MAGPDFLIPCAELFARAAERVWVAGRLLPDEARAVHRGFWSRGADIASVAPKPWHLLSRAGGPDAGYVPGFIGRIAELHATYYSAAVGFGAPFEAKVATELAQFCLGYQSGRDGLWLVQQDGVIHGSVAIDGSHHDESGAHLRWFITSDALRGQGAGSRSSPLPWPSVTPDATPRCISGRSTAFARHGTCTKARLHAHAKPARLAVGQGGGRTVVTRRMTRRSTAAPSLLDRDGRQPGSGELPLDAGQLGLRRRRRARELPRLRARCRIIRTSALRSRAATAQPRASDRSHEFQPMKRAATTFGVLLIG